MGIDADHLPNFEAARRRVEYLFLGKTGAVLQGFPDTTQDADLFVERTPETGAALTEGLRQPWFSIGEGEAADIRRGRHSTRRTARAFPAGATSPATSSAGRPRAEAAPAAAPTRSRAPA